MSVALNLSKKLEWMSRRLRWIDDAYEIQQWILAMTSINSLLKGVGKEKETYTDGWKPWKKKENLGTENTKEQLDRRGRLKDRNKGKATCRQTEVTLGEKGIEEAGLVLKESNRICDLGNTWHKGKRRRLREAQTPRVDVREEWKTVDAGVKLTDKDIEMTVDQKITEDTAKVEMVTLWRRELHKRLTEGHWDDKGCEYKDLLGEWHPTEALLCDIANAIDRSGCSDLKDNDLRNLLVYDITNFYKKRNW